MIQHILKATCDICGETKEMSPQEFSAYGWTYAHCPKCQRIKRQTPKNLDPEELRKKIMTFSFEVNRVRRAL